MSRLDDIALWVGYGALTTGGIACLAALVYVAAIMSIRAQWKCLESFGGWKVFIEYREWYRANKLKGQP